MKIFRNTRRIFSIVGYLPEEPVFTGKFGHAITSFVIFGTLAVCETINVVYAVRKWKIGDYQNCMYGFLQFAAMLPAVFSFCTFMCHKAELRDVIQGLQQIYDKCNANEFQITLRRDVVALNLFRLISLAKLTGELKPSSADFEWTDRFSENCLKIALIVEQSGFIFSSCMGAAITCLYYYKRDGLIEFKNIYLPLKSR